MNAPAPTPAPVQGLARARLRDQQAQLLHALAGAEGPEALRALVRGELAEDLCAVLRRRHLANVRELLARDFPVSTRALAPSDVELRRGFARLPGLVARDERSPGEERLAVGDAGLRTILAARGEASQVGKPILEDLLAFERGQATVRLRPPASLDAMLDAIAGLSPGLDSPWIDLGPIVLTRVGSNAPELFWRHDPCEAEVLGWQRWIAHARGLGWAGSQWLEFTDPRQLRVIVATLFL